MFGIKIIKEKKLNQLLDMIERQRKNCTALQGELENLHRLHQALWNKYQKSEQHVKELEKEARKKDYKLNKKKA